jgi:DNA-binding NarL/FixJ family response regulator
MSNTVVQIADNCLMLKIAQPDDWKAFRRSMYDFWQEVEQHHPYCRVVVLALEGTQIMMPGGNALTELRYVISRHPETVEKVVLLISHPLSYSIINQLIRSLQIAQTAKIVLLKEHVDLPLAIR